MDALVPAFVAALLTGVGDRPAWFAAITADRYGRTWHVMLGLAVAHCLVSAVAAAGALAVAPMMTPNARALVLAVALVFAGASALWATRPPRRLDRWSGGAFLTALLGGAVLALGDRTAFITFGFAIRSPTPFMAAAGAAAGGMVVSFTAAACGEARWLRLPLRRIGVTAGVILLVIGITMALSALRVL